MEEASKRSASEPSSVEVEGEEVDYYVDRENEVKNRIFRVLLLSIYS